LVIQRRWLLPLLRCKLSAARGTMRLGEDQPGQIHIARMFGICLRFYGGTYMEEKTSWGTSQCLVSAAYLSPPLSTGLQGPVPQEHPWQGKGCWGTASLLPQLLPARPYYLYHIWGLAPSSPGARL